MMVLKEYFLKGMLELCGAKFEVSFKFLKYFHLKFEVFERIVFSGFVLF